LINTLYIIKRSNANWSGRIRLRTALLKRYNGRENEEENVSSYWVALRKRD